MAKRLSAEQLVGRIMNRLDPGSFVTKFALVAEVIDTNGKRVLWRTGSEFDTEPWDTYGLLMWALQEERAQQIESRTSSEPEPEDDSDPESTM